MRILSEENAAGNSSKIIGALGSNRVMEPGDTEAPCSAFEEAIHELERVISDNSDLVAMLEKRIDLILTQEIEKVGVDEPSSSSPFSQIVRTIHHFSNRIRIINARLCEIRDRVEL